MRDIPFPDSLVQVQTWFAKLITAPIRETDKANIPLYPSPLVDEIRGRIAPGPQLTSEERLGIYQQQYWWRLLTVAQEIFPSLIRIFGYEEFNSLIAEPYLLKHLPNDWFLSNLGADLPQWIKRSYRGKDAPLVHGLALLDLAYENIPLADFLPTLEPDRISECAKEKLFLQPHVLGLKLDVDLFAFREELLQHPPEYWQTHDFPILEKSEKKKYFVLFRRDEKSVYEEISLGFFNLLARFKKGAKLIDLIPLLETFDGLLQTFQLMAARGWLSLSSPPQKN